VVVGILFITFYHLVVHAPSLEAGESLYVAFEAYIHASKGAQVPHEHVGMIEFLFYSECIFCFLHQPVSPGGGVLGTETPPGISWGQW
jgi:hypothetical protein